MWKKVWIMWITICKSLLMQKLCKIKEDEMNHKREEGNAEKVCLLSALYAYGQIDGRDEG